MQLNDAEKPEATPGGACAAVILYRPDKALLRRQGEGLRGVPLFAFSNEPVDADTLAALATGDLRLTTNLHNVGLAHGLNAVMEAAARSGFSHVLLLDQDSEPTIEIFAGLVARATALERAGERVAVLAPRLIPPKEGFYKPIRYERRGGRRADGLTPVHYAPTSGSLVSVAAYREIGPFRDDFFIAGIDVEWGFRAWSRGWTSYVAPDLAMPHRWGEAVDAGEMGKPQILRHAPLRNYYYARNVIATAKLAHVPLSWRAKSCAVLAAQIVLLAVRGDKGALGPIMSGLSDGFAGRLGPAP